MQSTATDVDAYLQEAPAGRQAVLHAIRQLCRDILPSFAESMQYGMPSYARAGVVEFAFASQKQYIAIYGLKQDALDSLRDAFTATGAKLGKGCVRYTRPEKIDLPTVERLLRATAA